MCITLGSCRRNWGFFEHCVMNAIAVAGILMVTYGGRVLEPPDCVSVLVLINIAAHLMWNDLNKCVITFTWKRQCTLK